MSTPRFNPDNFGKNALPGDNHSDASPSPMPSNMGDDGPNWSEGLWAEGPSRDRDKPSGPLTRSPLPYITPEQFEVLSSKVCAMFKNGENPSDIEQAIINFLRALPPGQLERGGWKGEIETLASLLTVAGVLADVVARSRWRKGKGDKP